MSAGNAQSIYQDAWAAGLRGVAVDFTSEAEGEYASIEAGSDLFALYREPGEVVICGGPDYRVICTRTLLEALEALAASLPGAPRTGAARA